MPEAAAPEAAAPEVAAEVLPAPPQHRLEAMQLVRRFGGIVAVDRVSFRIERGELIGLIGYSGSMLMGLA